MSKAREFWIHKNLKEVFEVAPWRIGRDAEVIHVIEATPATRAADEMLSTLTEALETDYYGKCYIETDKLKALIAKASK